jgi:xylulokinase
LTRAAGATGRLVLGVDAGTSGCKTVLLDESGEIVAADTCHYPTFRAPGGVVEQDPADWLKAFSVSVRTVMAGVPARQVGAIGVTAPAHNAVLMDAAGQPTAPVILWSDRRCAQVVQQQRHDWGEQLLARALVDLGCGWTLPQLAWSRANRPDAWRRTRGFLIGKDYLVHALTGRYGTDPSDAAGTAFYDPVARGWMTDLLDDAGIPPDWAPAIRPATDVVGGLLSSVAGRCGLRPGTPVVTGATDTAAELVSLGAVRPGDGLVKVATTGTVVVVEPEPRGRPGVLVYPHPEPGRWYALSAANSAGASLAWLWSVFSGTSVTPEAQFDEATPVSVGADGLVFLPNLDGSRSGGSPEFGAFVGLSAAHRREHLIRAVLEGVAFALADCWDRLGARSPMPERPFLTGGGLRNPTWAGIVLGVLGRSGRRVAGGEPATGAARLAAEGTGIDISAPAAHEVQCPAAATVRDLSEARARFRKVEQALRTASL